MSWDPAARDAERALEAAYPGVPRHLFRPLWSWVEDCFRDSTALMRNVLIYLRIESTDPTRGQSAFREAIRDVAAKCDDSPTMLLDLAQAILRHREPGNATRGELDALLASANSMYCVSRNLHDLESRVDPAVRDQVQAVVDNAPANASEHLRKAWAEAYGRGGDPGEAVRHAVKAVEAVAIPVVEPNNGKATLGTVLGALGGGNRKLNFVVAGKTHDGGDTVRQMMALVWDGNTSRHEGNAPVVAESPEQARAIVHLAATVVQLFVSGAVS